jgi:hypothetical protein
MLSRIWILSLGLLSGACSQLVSQAPQQPAESRQYIGQSASADLAAALEGQRLILAESPWGPSAEVLIRKRYFAATGRVCLEAEVGQQLALICDYQQAGWAAQRLLSQQDQ